MDDFGGSEHPRHDAAGRGVTAIDSHNKQRNDERGGLVSIPERRRYRERRRQSRRYDGFDSASGLTQKFGPEALRVGPIVQNKPRTDAFERKA